MSAAERADVYGLSRSFFMVTVSNFLLDMFR